MRLSVGLSTVLAAISPFQATAQDDAQVATAHQAIKTFIEAVASAEPDAIEAALAPEFQIMRASGVGYDADTYVADGLPKVDISRGWKIEELSVTGTNDLLVTRYHLVIEETVEEEAVEQRAPRLTVFRNEDGDWLVVAHANFAARE